MSKTGIAGVLRGAFRLRHVMVKLLDSPGATMNDPLLKAQYYHDQAARFRELAAQEDHASTREALIELAERYDRLATECLAKSASQAKSRS